MLWFYLDSIEKEGFYGRFIQLVVLYSMLLNKFPMHKSNSNTSLAQDPILSY